MQKTKKIIDIVIVIFSVLGIFMTCLYIYVFITDKGIYTNSTSTYVSSVTDPLTGEKMSPFEINYYANFNGSGKEVMEFRIRCYSDQRKTAIYSRGYQLVYDDNGNNTLYYYDSFNGNSWESGHIYDETNDKGMQKTFYYIDIESKVYAVRLDGTYSTYDTYYTFGDFFSTMWGCLVQNEHYIKYHTEETLHYYNYRDLLEKMSQIVRSSSYGTGNYTMPLVDLGDYLHVYAVDENGKVEDEPLGSGGLINSYFEIDVNFDKRGMSYAQQSIYKSVAGDRDFNITGIDFDITYWQAKQVYNLTEQDFEKRYSSVENGYYYSLPSSVISLLKNYKDLEINISFDISKLKDNVLGLDNFGLFGVKINEFLVKNNKKCSFSLLNGSLNETNLKVIKTKNAEIKNLSGMEVDYEMV